MIESQFFKSVYFPPLHRLAGNSTCGPARSRAKITHEESTKNMSTEAQIAANRLNAEHSTGPKTEEGKAISSRNHYGHGLSTHTYNDIFFLLPHESSEAYSLLRINLLDEHRPENETERILVDRMAQHHWLRSRAQAFESGCFRDDGTLDDKRLALFMRYRTSHERAFSKCLAELLKLRAEKRKAEIGFESRKRVKEEYTRKQERHEMAKEHHKWEILLAEAKLDHQQVLTLNEQHTQTMHSIDIERAKQAA
jgi:hypothetical protein